MDKISIDLLMNTYHIILNEEEINTQKKCLRITNKELQFVGLK